MDFRLSEEGIGKIRTKAIVSVTQSFVFFSLALLIVGYADENPILTEYKIWIARIAPLYVALQCWVVYRTVLSFRTFVVSIDEGQITRQQSGLPDMLIRQNELKSIEYSSNGYFLLTSTTGYDMSIPASMDNETELRALLQAMMPVEDKELVFWRKHAKNFLRLLFLACFFFYYTYRDTPLDGVVDWVMYGFIGIAAFFGLQRKGMSKVFKVVMWLLLVHSGINLVVLLLDLLKV